MPPIPIRLTRASYAHEETSRSVRGCIWFNRIRRGFTRTGALKMRLEHVFWIPKVLLINYCVRRVGMRGINNWFRCVCHAVM